MEQTVINATQEFLQSQIAALQEVIQKKDEHIQNVTQRSYAESADKNRIIDGMQEWTLEALENSQISQSNAEEIAEIVGFELTKEVEVEVTVTYYMTLQVPAGEDAESIVSDIDFDAVTYDTDKISYVTSNVESVDF